jgi:hypothetical protein
MAGKTGMLISLVHDSFVHVPMHMAVSRKNQIDPDKELWRDVIAATGQPRKMTCPQAVPAGPEPWEHEVDLENEAVLAHREL